MSRERWCPFSGQTVRRGNGRAGMRSDGHGDAGVGKDLHVLVRALGKRNAVLAQFFDDRLDHYLDVPVRLGPGRAQVAAL